MPGEYGCKGCGGPTEGYKCDMCGAEAESHDPNHACGGDHCLPKCKGCGEAESKTMASWRLRPGSTSEWFFRP